MVITGQRDLHHRRRDARARAGRDVADPVGHAAPGDDRSGRRRGHRHLRADRDAIGTPCPATTGCRRSGPRPIGATLRRDDGSQRHLRMASRRCPMMAGVRPTPGGIVRERGVQSRRVRESKETVRRPAPARAAPTCGRSSRSSRSSRRPPAGRPSRSSRSADPTPRPAMRRPSPATRPTRTPSDDPSTRPVADTHDAPDLEARPAGRRQRGDPPDPERHRRRDSSSDDAWSTTVTTFLTSVGKTATDLQFAQACRPGRDARRQLRGLPRPRRRRRQAARHADRGLEGRLPGPEGDRRHGRWPEDGQGRVRHGDAAELPLRPGRGAVRHLDDRPDDRRGRDHGAAGAGRIRRPARIGRSGGVRRAASRRPRRPPARSRRVRSAVGGRGGGCAGRSVPAASAGRPGWSGRTQRGAARARA